MAIGLGQEFNAARFVKLLQELDHLGSILFQKLDGASRDREGYFESFAIGLCHLQERTEGGNVRTLGSLGDTTFVLIVVEIIMILTDLEEAIALEMDVLMDLEV